MARLSLSQRWMFRCRRSTHQSAVGCSSNAARAAGETRAWARFDAFVPLRCGTGRNAVQHLPDAPILQWANGRVEARRSGSKDRFATHVGWHIEVGKSWICRICAASGGQIQWRMPLSPTGPASRHGRRPLWLPPLMSLGRPTAIAAPKAPKASPGWEASNDDSRVFVTCAACPSSAGYAPAMRRQAPATHAPGMACAPSSSRRALAFWRDRDHAHCR